jgi:hypothetical protein
MIEKDVKKEQLKKRAAKFELAGIGMMTFGGLEIFLTAMNPLLGLALIAAGSLLFRKGWKLMHP